MNSKVYFFYGGPGFGKTSRLISLYNAITKKGYKVTVFICDELKSESHPYFIENRDGKSIKLDGYTEEIVSVLSNGFSSIDYVLVDEVQNCPTDVLKYLLDSGKKIIVFGAFYGPYGEIIPTSKWLYSCPNVTSIPLSVRCSCDKNNAITSCYVNTKTRHIYTGEINDEACENKYVKLEFFCKECLNKIKQ